MFKFKISKKYRNLFTATLMLAVGLISCAEEEYLPVYDNGSQVSFFATLIEQYPATRATSDRQDGWSTATFNNANDIVGLFSSAGNMEVDNGNGPFINAPLMFSRSVAGTEKTAFQFDNPELQIDRSKFKYNETVL